MYTVAARQVRSATGCGSSAIIPSNRPKVIGSFSYEGPYADQAGTWLWNTAGLQACAAVDGSLARAWKRSPAKGRGWQVPHCANTFVQSAFVAVCTRCGSSGPHADRVTNQTRLAKLREG